MIVVLALGFLLKALAAWLVNVLLGISGIAMVGTLKAIDSDLRQPETAEKMHRFFWGDLEF